MAKENEAEGKKEKVENRQLSIFLKYNSNVIIIIVSLVSVNFQTTISNKIGDLSFDMFNNVARAGFDAPRYTPAVYCLAMDLR